MATSTVMFTFFLKRTLSFPSSTYSIQKTFKIPLSTAVKNYGDLNFRNCLRKSVEDIQNTMMAVCKLQPGSLPTETIFSESRSEDPLECLKYGDLQHILQNPITYGVPPSQHLEHLPHDNHVATSMKSLFTYGIQCLLNYCDHNHTNETTIFPLIFYFQQFWEHKEKEEISLKTVLQTLNPINGNLITESDICSIFAVHLLSPLVNVRYPKFPYIISNDNSWKSELCQCARKTCREKVLYGSTLIGSRDLFFEKPDVVVFPNKGAVGVLLQTPSGYKDLHDYDEEEEEVLRLPESVSQLTRQAITFSYYQRGSILRNPDLENGSVTLIPTISISPTGFDVYMYDSKYDVFLKNFNNPFPLWDENDNLNMTSVVLLWMLLNHVSFKPKLNKIECSLLSHSFGFQKGEVDEERRALNVAMWNVLPGIPKSDNIKQNSADIVDFMDGFPECKKLVV